MSERLVNRRPSGQLLRPLIIPPTCASEPVRLVTVQAGDMYNPDEKEVVEEGKALLEEFIYEEIQKEQDLNEMEYRSTPQNQRIWANTGREIRQMADRFARTEERRRVWQRSQQMGVNVSYEEFRELLSQLFEGGVTQERIIALFYFCSDVAKNALRAGKNLFQQFLNWSLSFIVEYVCQWVYRHGGWGQVLKSRFNSVLKICMWVGGFSVSAIILFKYIRPRLF